MVDHGNCRYPWLWVICASAHRDACPNVHADTNVNPDSRPADSDTHPDRHAHTCTYTVT